MQALRQCQYGHRQIGDLHQRLKAMDPKEPITVGLFFEAFLAVTTFDGALLSFNVMNSERVDQELKIALDAMWSQVASLEAKVDALLNRVARVEDWALPPRKE
jgi:hypothetical protein